MRDGSVHFIAESVDLITWAELISWNRIVHWNLAQAFFL